MTPPNKTTRNTSIEQEVLLLQTIKGTSPKSIVITAFTKNDNVTLSQSGIFVRKTKATTCTSNIGKLTASRNVNEGE